MLTTGDRLALAEERDYLLRSIEDLEAEREAGNLSQDDYEQLRTSYVARAARVLRAIEVIEATEATEKAVAEARADARAVAHSGIEPAARGVESPGGKRAPALRNDPKRTTRLRRALGRRSTRRWLGACLAVCFAGILALLALRVAGVRLPGEGVSGGVTVNSAQRIQLDLEQAQALGAAGQVRQALILYQDVLTLDPRQAEALAYRGWLVRLTGIDIHSKDLIATGRASIEEAIAVEPRYGDAHFFLGLVLLEDYRDLGGAIAQIDTALSDQVSPELVHATKPIVVKAFRTAGDPVPSSVADS